MNLDIANSTVLLVAAFNLILGCIILAQDYRNRTNISFAVLCGTVAVWGFEMVLFRAVPLSESVLFDFAARAQYATGGFIPTILLYFSLVFNSKIAPLWRTNLLVFLPSVIFFVLYFFTHLMVTGGYLLEGNVRGIAFGPIKLLFDVHIWVYFVVAFVVLAKKYLHFSGQERQQIMFIIFGTYSSLSIAGVTNIILPMFSIFKYNWVGPIATLLWVLSVGYSVIRHQLFNVRVIVAELLIILLWAMFLARVVISRGESDFIINATFFMAVLVLGVFLMRSVIKKIEQREKIEQQDKQLALVNNKQESLLNFISHEVKGYFAKSEAAFAGIKEGDYGEAPESLKEMATSGLKDIRLGTSMVINILDASNMKKGVVSYKESLFDMKKTLYDVAGELRSDAEAKGLILTVSDNVKGVCVFKGDEAKIRKHVIRNLVDNAIRYTPSGSVKVELTRTNNSIRIVIEDTGIGITLEDRERLFTEGGHGKDSLKVNVHSTGYGLFVAKQVVEAHHGTIHAVSEGPGKGAKFVVEFVG